MCTSSWFIFGRDCLSGLGSAIPYAKSVERMKILQSHLLFFDIDGTLVDEETGVLTQETKRALKNARKNGHLVFLNTGRSYSELDPAVVAVGFDGFVCGCGTHVKVHDETLVKCTVEGSHTITIFQVEQGTRCLIIIGRLICQVTIYCWIII